MVSSIQNIDILWISQREETKEDSKSSIIQSCVHVLVIHIQLQYIICIHYIKYIMHVVVVLVIVHGDNGCESH